MKGPEAERAAADHLAQRGLALIARNYRCRFGEIDLIMRDGETLVFVEVRMRSSSAFGGAAESITLSKRAKLLSAARHYLGHTGVFEDCRFDAVLLNDDTDIEWIRDAFGE